MNTLLVRSLAHRLRELTHLFGEPRHRSGNTASAVALAEGAIDDGLEVVQVHPCSGSHSHPIPGYLVPTGRALIPWAARAVIRTVGGVTRTSFTSFSRCLLVAGAASFVATACSSDGNDAATTTTAAATDTTVAPADGAPTTTAPAPGTGGDSDIVATALTNHVFTQLAGLVVDAGLVETLRGGPFTVFAPTDDAFAKLPTDVLHAVQSDPDTLTTVLLHHVVAGAITPDQLVAGTLTSAAGTTLTVTKVGDQFFVDGNAIGAGVAATNGEVYVMNDVLVPALGNIVEVATALPGFGTLTDLVTQAELVSTLQGAGPFTVFAPIDSAFDALPKATLDAVLADPALLATVLTYHVVAGKLTTDQLVDGPLMTVAGVALTISHKDGVVLVDGKPIAVQNVQATNGVIQVMGDVLVPKS